MTAVQKTYHLEVFYIDRRNGWAVAAFDAEGNQQGEASFCFHKADAIRVADDISKGKFEVHVYGMNGERQK